MFLKSSKGAIVVIPRWMLRIKREITTPTVLSSIIHRHILYQLKRKKQN